MFNYFRALVWNWASHTRPFKGKERLVSFVSRPRGTRQLTIVRQRVRWHILGHDQNEFNIAVRANHSPKLSEFLVAELRTGTVRSMWDIGANIGAIALPLLAQYPELQMTMFEPSAEVAGRLIKNVANNPELIPRSTIMNLALSDSIGISRFYVSNETFNSGVAGLARSANRVEFGVNVQTYSGDSLIDAHTCVAPQLVKIDVEGFELEVLKGLQKTLAAHHPVILFEHSVHRFGERGQPLDVVTSFLESLGYAIHRLTDSRVITADDLLANGDFVARPRSEFQSPRSY
jgi:FkbM family methyltransferase